MEMLNGDDDEDEGGRIMKKLIDFYNIHNIEIKGEEEVKI